jgi:UDP-N-acetylmuramyl pentapeptide phosphotransferase/UDP-N-acetylglucosamine-1-phosphate transferase
MNWSCAALSFAVPLMASFAASRLALNVLSRYAVLDHPVERSSHARPTPSGGGVAVIAVVVVAWGLIAALSHTRPAPAEFLILLAGGIFLAAISFADDLKGLSPPLRLAAQAAAVAAVLYAMADRGPYFAGILPPMLDTIAAGVFWLWFINLFNFMDGTDGIAGVETTAIGIGVFLVAWVAGSGDNAGLFGLSLAGAATGFLWWNWQPAKIFLGDVGSVPIGFFSGWLLLNLAAGGLPVAALILPLYFIADATITLAKRGLHGEKVWTPHRQHFYQAAVKRGESHAWVAASVALANVFLVAFAALAASGQSWPALIGATVVVAVLLARLGGWNVNKTSAGRGS